MGFQGTISESQEAQRFYRAGPPAVADDATHMKLSMSGTSLTWQSGGVTVCGVSVDISNESVSASTFSPVVAVEVSWSGSTSRARLVAVSESSLVRNPGSKYHMPIAKYSRSGWVKAYSYGGRGGPMRCPEAAGLSLIDAHDGARIICDDTTDMYQRVNSSWVQIGEKDSSWSFYTPKMTFEGAGDVQAGDVYLGNGGVYRGRYKVDNGFCMGEIELRRGTSGYFFGRGAFFVTLPVAPDAYFTDRWLSAHMYTDGDGLMDWQCQAMIRSAETKARLWAPHNAADCRLEPARSTDATGNPGVGVPGLAGNNTNPAVVTVQLMYSVG